MLLSLMLDDDDEQQDGEEAFNPVEGEECDVEATVQLLKELERLERHAKSKPEGVPLMLLVLLCLCLCSYAAIQSSLFPS